MSWILLQDRTLLRISGEDRVSFLQGLITNDMRRLSPQTPLYACLLNPQGKILFDFFLYDKGDSILVDVWKPWGEALRKRLGLYKLRANVTIVDEPTLAVSANIAADIHAKPAVLDQAVMEPIVDPRHAGMGARAILEHSSASEDPSNKMADDMMHYHQHRIALGIPESADFIEGRAFTAEYGIAALNGVSFTKGCYVGQEVVARTQSRGTVRKALYKISAMDTLPAAGAAIMSGEKEVGQLRGAIEGHGLAVLRIESAQQAAKSGELSVNGQPINATLPDWWQATSASPVSAQ